MDELLIEAKIENTSAVIDFVNRRLLDCPQELRNYIGVVVDEVFSNISRYAYNPQSGCSAVRVAVGDDVITLEFEDSGSAYNPLNAAEPDITSPAEERGLGGLGIFIVKNIMDSVEYKREGNKNILTLKKKY